MVIEIGVRIQDRILGFFTIARYGEKFANRIKEKVTDGFASNFHGMLGLAELRGD